MFSEYSILSSNLKLIFGTLLIFIFLARFDLIMPESLSRILLSILLSDLLIDLPITVKNGGYANIIRDFDRGNIDIF